MAIRTLWRYVINKARTVVKNYNVIERAETVLETEKRPAPPRHPGTEAKFKVLVKGNPNVKTDMEKKPTELLDRLKIVKVTSEGDQEDLQTTRPLPQSRQNYQLPLYGFDEPKAIPEGRCSLRQALEFITKHENDPEKHSIQALAETYKIKSQDIKDVLDNFKVFQMYQSRDGSYAAESLASLGVGKVVRPILKAKFAEEMKTKEPKKEPV